MRPKVSFLIIVLLLSLLANTPTSHSQPAPPLLRLHRGAFEATQATSSATPSSLLTAAPGAYAILQLRGPITLVDRTALESTGVKLLEYLPDFAYLAQGTPKQLAAAARLPQVYARTPFTLADKFAPAILRVLQRGENNFGPVHVIGWPDDNGALTHDLSALAANQPITFNATQLLQAANLESVRWIEPASHPFLLNDHARAIMNVDAAWENQSLFGAGQIIAVADSGLDTGDMLTMSPDFAGRITATHVLSPTGDWGDGHGHGTHVTGSIAGAGVQSGAITATHTYTGSFAGVAPEASLVIQAFEIGSDGSLLGLPNDYYTLFSQAYTDGARLHSDSWGFYTGSFANPPLEETFGGYPYGSQRTDEFLWDHPDMTIFFAAGNSGVDGPPNASGFCFFNDDGVIDPDSLLAPATAKNIVTIGAAESDRSTGGFGSYPWSWLNPFCFASSPIAEDYVANNAEGMAAFSSRGPTDDGRIKPDIVAPGTNIVSNHTHYSNPTSALWGPHETNGHYAYDGGTSMATPLTAGAGALVREWLVSQGLANPSAAAVKATLLNTTHDMAPGQYGTGTTQEIPYNRPNSVAGWGRVDLGFIEAATPYTLWVDDHTTGLTTGQVITYSDTLTRPLQVTDSSQPLRIMLAWTDPPASLSASTQLVNDLDLVITGPGNTTYYGNSVATGDRLNNVEGVIISNPPIGEYQVHVTAYNVPIESQPFALVVAGPLAGGTPTATPTWTNTPVPPTDTPTWTNTPVPPTDTPTWTNTPVPPTDTPMWTNTPVPPTDTPTKTNTPVPPTDTPTKTNTPVPPTDTPTKTNTPVSPTDTPTRTNTPVPPNLIYLPLVMR